MEVCVCFVATCVRHVILLIFLTVIQSPCLGCFSNLESFHEVGHSRRTRAVPQQKQQTGRTERTLRSRGGGLAAKLSLSSCSTWVSRRARGTYAVEDRATFLEWRFILHASKTSAKLICTIISAPLLGHAQQHGANGATYSEQQTE
jgi:hypothetical protein